MPNTDEELIINIDDDAGIHAGEKHEAVEDLKSQFDTLKKQTEEYQQRAEAAERRVSQVSQEAGRWQQEAHTARTEVADRELDTIVSGIAAAQAEAEAASAAWAKAAEEGNFAAQAEAQRRIARAEAKLGRLDEAKADVETRRDPQSRSSGRVEGRSDRHESRPPADPVETFIQSRDPETQRWLRAHPDDARALILEPNSKRGMKLNAAHSDAVAEGFREGSAEYFSHIENFIGLAKKEQQVNGQQQQNGSGERQRRPSAPAAPVSGASGAGAASVGGGTQVRLSKGEVEAATGGTVVWNRGSPHPKTGEPIKDGDPLIGQPIGTKEYARRKLAQAREGLHDPGRYLVEQ